MTDKVSEHQSQAARREARLKAALKANMGRRKEQARGKAKAEQASRYVPEHPDDDPT